MESGLNIDPQNVRGSVKIKAVLSCPICSLMLRSPVMRCEECGNYFCQICLTDWWSKQNEPGKCIYKCNTSQLKVVKREATFSPMLQLLQFPCQNSGCQQVMTHQTLKKHLQTCEYDLVVCEYCDISKIKKQINQHYQQCDLKPSPCIHCKQQFLKKQISGHESSCPQRLIKCQNVNCQQLYTQISMKNHIQSCQYKQVKCEWCAKILFFKQLNSHNQICQLRKFNCQGCKQTFLFNQIDSHERSCDFIRMQCKVCNKQFTRKQINSIHTLNQCMIDEIKSLRKENILLRQSNIQLKLLMENILLKYQNLESQQNKSKSKIEQSNNKEMMAYQKDFQRLDYSIGSLEKLKAQEFTNHMKKPHLFGDWCPICKQIQKKFAKMIEPLQIQRNQAKQKIRMLRQKLK